MIGVISNFNTISIGGSSHLHSTVDIYILPDCPWSARALKLLDFLNVKYNSYLITNDEQFKKMSNKSSSSTFPQIFIKNQFIGGYSELSSLFVNGDLI